MVQFNELACYVLPGHISEPRAALAEIRDAEQIGLGSVFISERFAAKNADVLSGAAAVLAPSLGIASGLIQTLPLRHPIVTAGYAATMAKLTGDRFALGVGRGTDAFADSTGTPRLTFRLLEDYIGLLRRLWRGERVDYEGPLGRMRGLKLGVDLPVTPPVIMAAMGEKTLRWAGGVADGVLLNSLWTAQAVERAARLIRRGAEEAGRDPASVRIWCILVTACDVPESAMLNYVVRRMNTYLLFPAMFDGICDANGWDRADAARLREQLARLEAPAPAGTMGDEATTRDLAALRQMAEAYPTAWLRDGNAIGSSIDGARAALERIQAGADGIVFHGCQPRELAGIVSHWRALRPPHLRQRPLNPGL